jgi:S1-C subfamily serine protease
MKSLILGIILAIAAVTVKAAEVTDLQDISVTIKAPSGGMFGGESQGSGVMFTRGDTTFVWTAGHVVAGLRHERHIIDPDTGTDRTVIEFRDAEVVQEFTEDGRRIGEMKFDAKIIKYSEPDNGQDLSVLEIRKKNFTKVTTVFYLDESIPKIGTKLLHVGSLLGQFGSNSLTSGIVSKIGRTLDLGNTNVIFDQTTVTAFPGSSGGGVFQESDYRYIGMLVRGAGEQFNFIVPVRRMKDWAKSTKIMWAMDPKVAMPSAEERQKIPVEDSGHSFKPAYDKAAAGVPHLAPPQD